MNLSSKLTALDRIYAIYDEFTVSLDLACRKHCAHCCTTGVTLTTIEGYKTFKKMESEGDTHWIEKIEQASRQPHFQLKITTNQLANMCAEGIEPPVEENTGWDTCPFLTDDLCPLYTARPFGCRCLVSRHDCGKEGYAEIDDFVLSANTLFLQTIEHMDAGGCTGNLLDMLGVMAVKENRQAYADGKLKSLSAGLIANQPLKILMIPPEHRNKMDPILQSLKEICI
ncbi:MAG: YkgJ family cysteine cluster protein [Desulfobacterales bacterium]|nr:YkgJ family cysteine cluster protein [Desulfobacterales bacterium]